jgi:hypothetical protein
MSLNTLKLSLAAAGIAVFLLGTRAGSQAMRWTGIALVAAAWLLRFVGRGGADARSSTDPKEDA